MTYPHNDNDRREVKTMAIISEGSYLAKAIGITGIKAKTGTQGIQIAFKLIDDGPFKDREIDWVGWMSDSTRERTAESLATAGVTIDERGKASISPSHVVQLVIEHEEWTNEETGKSGVVAKVRWVNDANRGRTQFSPMEGAQQDQAMLSLRGLLMSQYEAKAKATPPAAKESSFDFGANVPPAAAPEAPPVNQQSKKALF